MSDWLFTLVGYAIGMLSLLAGSYLIYNGTKNKNVLVIAPGLLLAGLGSSCIPFNILGLMFGIISVAVNTVFVSVALYLGNKENNL